MNKDERKEKVKKTVDKALFQVLGGSISDVLLNSLIEDIDNIYLPHLKENGESV